ncbi:MAG TPA: helix-turn-helix domain-containing protein [Blastocatellia bacterium]|nr:helix-turn-helix domain-containing protein [Blastocatellia bacterium]
MRDSGGKKKASRAKKVEAQAESPLNSLVNETVLLFHRLRIVADQIHHRGETTGALRSILRSLDKLGEQTVPQMARARAVSRQHVQALVNQLVEERLVEFISNPAHKRSPLARLTPLGKKTVDAMNRDEAGLLSKAGLGVPDQELLQTAETLRTVRAYFESERWKRLLKNLK